MNTFRVLPMKRDVCLIHKFKEKISERALGRFHALQKYTEDIYAPAHKAQDTHVHKHIQRPVIVALEGFTNHTPAGIHHSCPVMTRRSVTVAVTLLHKSASLIHTGARIHLHPRTNHVTHIFLPHLIMSIIMYDYTCCPPTKAVGGLRWSH